MIGRDEKENSRSLSIDKFNEQMRVVASGTLIGLGGRWATWPLEYAMYKASEKTNTKPLLRIYAELFNWNALSQLNKSFLETGFTQTIGKSMANLGVLHYIDCYYSHLTPIVKGLFAACISAPFETIVTSRGEYRKVQRFYQSHLYTTQMSNLFFPSGFSRVVAANFMRNFPTSIITFGGIYKITEVLKPLFPSSMSDSPSAKGISATLANIAIQPLNMPFINFQTYVLRNPNKPTGKAVVSFFEEHTVREIFKGTSARIINRGIFYGLTFMASTYLKERGQARQSNALENQEANAKPKRP